MDNLTPSQRSRTMSLIRSQDTTPELTIRRLLFSRGMRFRKHDNSLPGCPDLVFVKSKVAVFIEGDYWHGWRFPLWKKKLAPYWQAKIEGNRQRDRRNLRRLRTRGWLPIRIWEHDVERDPERCVERVVVEIQRRLRSGSES